MRKLWILALAALVLVSFAAISFAAETTFSGSYRIRAVMDYNFEKKDVNGNEPLYTGYFDQRFRLTITHKRSEFLKAVVSVDLLEDIWGQGRAGRINNSAGTLDGFINTAYIEAITPVGLIKVGTDGTTRYGYGLWSDSGLRGNGTNNPSITYAIKVDRFIATVSYIKYVDFVQPVIDNKAGYPAGTIEAWHPGGAPSLLSGAGGWWSKYYNADTDTYVLTAHYIGDKFKVGGLFQWVLDPDLIGASLLVPGLTDFGAFPGSFSNEGTWLLPTGPLAIPGGAYWPTPGMTTEYGMGRMGMYGANLYIADMYFNLKLLNDKLEVKGEFTKVFGGADLNGLGKAYNATVLAGFGGLAGYLPDYVQVDGTTAYLDVSYDFEVFKVGLAFLYGGGEKHWNPVIQDHYNFNTTGNDDFRWGNLIVSGDWQFLGSSGAPLGLGNNPENITSVKLYWSVYPMEKLDIHGAFIWAKYTEPVGRYAMVGGAYAPGWNAFYGHPANYIDPTGTVYVPAGVSDQLGWEIDLGVTYEIMEGLSLNSEFGVLFTGSAFDYRDTTTWEREEWGPIYRWVNTLTYEF